MRYIDWQKISNCSFEERGRMRSYIDDLIGVKYEIEEQGVCALDKFSAPGAEKFESVAARLIVNGYTPEVCEDVLYCLLNASDMTNEQYLKGVILSEFLLAVQAKPIGVQELKLRLLAYLGVEFMTEME